MSFSAAFPYQGVGRLASLQRDLQIGKGSVHLVHFLLAVVHVVVRRHDGQLVDVVLAGEREGGKYALYSMTRNH